MLLVDVDIVFFEPPMRHLQTPTERSPRYLFETACEIADDPTYANTGLLFARAASAAAVAEWVRFTSNRWPPRPGTADDQNGTCCPVNSSSYHLVA